MGIQRYGFDVGTGFFCESTGGAFVKHVDHLESHAFDETKERELFESFYRAQFAEEAGKDLTAEDMVSMRDGPFYGHGRHFLNGQWLGWKACAKSRAEQ